MSLELALRQRAAWTNEPEAANHSAAIVIEPANPDVVYVPVYQRR